jgi:hypothetical protein
MGDKETRVADMPVPDETKSIAKPRTTSVKPSSQPKPSKSKD